MTVRVTVFPRVVIVCVWVHADKTCATVLTAAPALAQTYNPAYPVCLHVYGRGANYYECRYTSLPQCNASASGRAAQCTINPYFAGAQVPAGPHYRWQRRVY